MILFRNVFFSKGKSTTRFGVSPFFLGKVTIFIRCCPRWQASGRCCSPCQLMLSVCGQTHPSECRLQNNNNDNNNTNHNNNNNTIWGGSVLTGEEPPPHSGELQHALSQAGGPTQSQLSRPVSSGHHISMEHRLRRKQLNSDTNASNTTYLKEIQEKRKKKIFLRKNEKMKNIKKSKNEEMNKK